MKGRIRVRKTKYAGGPYKTAALILILLFIFAAFFLGIELKLRPIVQAYAEGRARFIATQAINEAVEEELEKQGSIYNNLIYFEKNKNGDILAVKTDSIKVNRMKSAILSRINLKISEQPTASINIPLGNIINGELFSGRGPKIPILIEMINSANASFISEFSEAGINQTKHRILINAAVNMSVLLPGGKAYFQIETQVNLAETLIIGKVPDTYTAIVDSRESILEKYNDYGGES